MDFLIRMSLGFGPGVVSTLREVGVLCSKEECLPHGYIDLFVYSEDKAGSH